MLKKRSIFVLIALSLLILVVILVVLLAKFQTIFAYESQIPIPQTRSGVYFYDSNNIIDDEAEKLLNPMLVELNKNTDVTLEVLAIDSLQKKSVQEYSQYVFEQMDFGQENKDNCILLLFSRSDFIMEIQTGQEVQKYLTNIEHNEILDKYLSSVYNNNDYSSSVAYAVENTIKLVADKYEISIANLDETLANANSTHYDSYNMLSAMFDGFMTLIYGFVALLVLFYAIKAITGHDDEIQ